LNKPSSLPLHDALPICEVFQHTLAQKDHQLARIHAIWGISQLARKDLSRASSLVPLLKDPDPEIRAQAAKWLGDIRYAGAGSERSEEHTSELQSRENLV